MTTFDSLGLQGLTRHPVCRVLPHMESLHRFFVGVYSRSTYPPKGNPPCNGARVGVLLGRIHTSVGLHSTPLGPLAAPASYTAGSSVLHAT